MMKFCSKQLQFKNIRIGQLKLIIQMPLLGVIYWNQSIQEYKLLGKTKQMIKPHKNHPSIRAPSILQVPKPLQRINVTAQTKNRIKTIRYGENHNIEHIKQCLYQKDGYKITLPLFNTLSPALKEENKNTKQRGLLNYRKSCNPQQHAFHNKKQLQEIAQPQGDTSQSPLINAVQLKQCISLRLSLPVRTSRNSSRKQVRSISHLQRKNKPALTSRDHYDNQQRIRIENQILKKQNQKLKQLSQERKNQISVLFNQVFELKGEIQTLIEKPQFIEFKSAQQIEQLLIGKQAIIKRQPKFIAKDEYVSLKEAYILHRGEIDTNDNTLHFQ